MQGGAYRHGACRSRCSAPHENLAMSMAHGYAAASGKAAGGHGACQRRHRQRAVRRDQRGARERADPVHRRPHADDRGRAARRARHLHPLGAGDVRPGRHGARDGQVGLRAAQRRAARDRGRPRADDRRPAAPRGAGLPVAAARGAGGAAARFRRTTRRRAAVAASPPAPDEAAVARGGAAAGGGAEPAHRHRQCRPRPRGGAGRSRGLAERFAIPVVEHRQRT